VVAVVRAQATISGVHPPGDRQREPARGIRSLAPAANALALLAGLLLPAFVLASAGDLDPSFSRNGKATANFGHHNLAYSVAIDGRDRAVVAGGILGGHHDFELARYTAHGRLDASFSRNGKVRTEFGRRSVAQSVAVDSRQRILAAGTAAGLGGGGGFALARYRRDGSLDPSFGSGGKVITDIGSHESDGAVVIDSQGRIVVAGSVRLPSPPRDNFAFALARYMPDGELDDAFSGDGKLTTDFGSLADNAYDVAVDPEDRIVAAGRGHTGVDFDFALARYQPNGELDSTFGAGGRVTTDFGDSDGARSVAIDPRGRIVAVGRSDLHRDGFALARYRADGKLDPTFGGNGKARTRFAGFSEAHSVAIDPRGRLVVGGLNARGFALARYRPDGSRNRSFSHNGKLTTDFGSPNDGANSVAIDSRERILAAGYGRGHFAVARYIGGPNR
jgi:uncharacterized delta-60 repeat protein